MIIHIRHEVECKGQRLIVAEADEVGAVGQLQLGITLEFEVVEVNLAPCALGKHVPVLETSSQSPARVIVQVECGIHVPPHGPEEGLGIVETFGPVVA